MAERLVLDASVAAKWFLTDPSEQNTGLADALLDDLLASRIEVHVPRLFFYEVARVLSRAVATKGRNMDAARVAVCLRKLFQVPLVVWQDTNRELLEAVRLSSEHSKTSYDMSYLFLAGELDCQWCTADEKVAKGQGGRFPRSRVQLLAERS